MVRFKRKKTYSRSLTWLAFLTIVILAIVVLFMDSPASVILGTAALTAAPNDTVFDSAALIVSNADAQTVVLWIIAVLAATATAFLAGRFLDKRYGKFVCINCVRKDTYIRKNG